MNIIINGLLSNIFLMILIKKDLELAWALITKLGDSQWEALG
jgi:hypothetical protein